MNRRGKVLLFCKIQEDRQKGKIECACGHQRYCPKEKKSILTDGALKCPVRENYEQDKYGDSRNAEGVQYADFSYHKGQNRRG